MINTSNYMEVTAQLDMSKLPETLLNSHQFVLKSTRQGTDWTLVEKNDKIRKVINIYFVKLDEYLKSAGSTVKKNSVQLKPEPTSPENASNVRKASEPKQKKKYKDKSERTTTKEAEDDGDEPVKAVRVEMIREEVKFIKRYISLHNKSKTPQQILTLIKALQRAIVQKLIRKTSPLAGEIQKIQEKLIQVYNGMKGEESFSINPKDLSRLVGIVGGEEVYPSIKIMKRVIGLQGKKLDRPAIARLQKSVANALEKKKVSKEDPYYNKVKEIYNTFDSMRANETVKISKAELNGLEAIIKGCGCGRKKESRRIKNKHVDSPKSQTLNGVLTAEEMAKRKFDLLSFTSPWQHIIGNPATNFTMMLHGEPHNGKTTILLRFAEYLANNFGEVLYVTSEEFNSFTMTKKIKELFKHFPERLHFAEDLSKVNVGDYQFVILDSINDMKLKQEDFRALRQDNLDTAFILILQNNKSGQFRGGKDWEHMVDIAGEVENGVINIYKNRHGHKSSFDFFGFLNQGTSL